jgi:SH3-like domain-containing protein
LLNKNNRRNRPVPATRLTKLLLALPLAWLPAIGWALDYRVIAVEQAILYDAPSSKAKKLFIVGRDYPVEVVVNLGGWIKVRDSGGDLAWVEAANLAERREVQVMVAQADVLESANEAARPVFRADKNLLLELLEASPDGWVKVRHRDGLSGYIQSSKVWGL